MSSAPFLAPFLPSTRGFYREIQHLTCTFGIVLPGMYGWWTEIGSGQLICIQQSVVQSGNESCTHVPDEQ